MTCPMQMWGMRSLPAKEDVWMTRFTVSLLLATEDKTFWVPCTAGSTKSLMGSSTSLQAIMALCNAPAAKLCMVTSTHDRCFNEGAQVLT